MERKDSASEYICKLFRKSWFSGDKSSVLNLSSCRILLAVSGGVDSMTMAELFYNEYASNGSFDIAVAHVNFSLRGEDSDLDYEFVKKWASDRNLQFFGTKYDTVLFAEENKISIEMAARKLRYEWFNSVAHRNGYKYIALAHNKNDNAETLILNLVRGTGLEGATGIKQVSEFYLDSNINLIRPILFLTRSQIEDYAHANNISFRVDKTNLESEFKRNRVRNQVIPILHDINPSVIESLSEDISNFQKASYFNKWAIDKIYSSSIPSGKDYLSLNKQFLKDSFSVAQLLSISDDKAILSYILSTILYTKYGFNYTQSDKIVDTIQGGVDATKYVKSADYIAEISASQINIYSLAIENIYAMLSKQKPLSFKFPQNQGEQVVLNFGDKSFSYCIAIEKKGLDEAVDNKSVRHRVPNTLLIDARDIASQTAEIRLAKSGDRFRPFGMKSGSKSVADYLTDKKIPTILKRMVGIIESNNSIISLLALEIDDRYALRSDTKEYYSISVSLSNS